MPIDLSPISDRVLGRITQLPLAEEGRVTLLHVVASGLPAAAEGRAVRDAKRLLATEARELARALPRGVGLDLSVRVGKAAAEIAACARSTRAELIVMGRVGASALRDVFLGSTAERVIRSGQLPVLVVRLPARTAYRRPALALDFDRAAFAALALTLRVLSPPRPPVLVIHAFEQPYHGMYPSLSEDDLEESSSELKRELTRKITGQLAAALAPAKVPPIDAPRWKTHVQQGSARRVVKQLVKKADSDLLVLGTHGYSGVAHVLLGTVAGDLLRDVACDALIVPGPR